MKKFIKNHVSKLALLSALVFSPYVKANLDFKMMKEVTRFLNKGKKRYSLTLGKTALESGLIHNLRFYGNFDSKVEGGKRIYSKDENKEDPVWTLVKTLFPSTDGNLKAYAGSAKFTPETLGNLLNFIDDLRKTNDSSTGKVKSELNQKLGDKLSKNTNIKKLISTIEKAIKEEEGFYPQGTTEQIILAFACEKLDSREDLYKFMNSLNNNIVSEGMHQELTAKITQITTSSSSDELTKKVIEDISKKADPYTLDDVYALSHAKDLVMNLSPYPRGEKPGQNIPTLVYDRTKKEQTISFSDCVETVIRHVFNSVLYMPNDKSFNLNYLKGLKSNNTITNNISNSTSLLDSLIDFYQPNGQNLRDVKDAISNSPVIHNDWNKVVGDLNALDKGNPVKITYSESLDKRDMLGNGEYNMNPGFSNMVYVFQKILGISLDVSDPNDPDKKAWVTDSLKKIFEQLNPDQKYNLKFDEGAKQHEQEDIVGTLTVTTLDKKDKELVSFDIVMQPQHGYVANIKNLSVSDADEEAYLVKIPDYEGALQLHSQDLRSDTSLDPVLESIWLLNLQNKSLREKLVKEGIRHPLYQLFDHKLGEVDANIQFIEHLAELLPQWSNIINDDDTNNNYKISPSTFKKQLKKITDHIVSSLPEDLITDEKLMQAFRKLITVKGWEEVFSTDRITKFSIEKAEEIDVVHHLEALKELTFRLTEKKDIEFKQNMSKLEILDFSMNGALPEEGVKGLHHLSALKELKFGNQNIKFLDLKEVKSLESIDFSTAQSLPETIEKIDGIKDLKNLKLKITLDKINYFSSLENLTELSLFDKHQKQQAFKGQRPRTRGNLGPKSRSTPIEPILEFKEKMPNLKILDLSQIGKLSEIKGLNYLTNLEELKVSNLTGNLSLSNLTKLKVLDLTSSSIDTIDSLPDSLEKLTVTGGKIGTIKLSEMNKDFVLEKDSDIKIEKPEGFKGTIKTKQGRNTDFDF